MSIDDLTMPTAAWEHNRHCQRSLFGVVKKAKRESNRLSFSANRKSFSQENANKDRSKGVSPEPEAVIECLRCAQKEMRREEAVPHS